MAEETYAFSRLEGAFHRTKSLLWPVRWGVWLRLAVVALFLGAASVCRTSSSINLMGVILRRHGRVLLWRRADGHTGDHRRRTGIAFSGR